MHSINLLNNNINHHSSEEWKINSNSQSNLNKTEKKYIYDNINSQKQNNLKTKLTKNINSDLYSNEKILETNEKTQFEEELSKYLMKCDEFYENDEIYVPNPKKSKYKENMFDEILSNKISLENKIKNSNIYIIKLKTIY